MPATFDAEVCVKDNVILFHLHTMPFAPMSCGYTNKAENMATTDPTRVATKEELQTLSMFSEPLPQDPEWLEKKAAHLELRRKLKEERKKYGNVLSEQLNRLMNHKGVEASQVAKATGIPESTLHGWINFIVTSQEVSSGLKAIANYFGVTVDFMAYGIPVTEEEKILDEIMPEIERSAGEIA